MLRVFGCITEEHDLRLVALAACICLVASFTTLCLLSRARATPQRSTWTWLTAAACVFGCGVWSLHFIAMLAFMPSLPIAYDISTTFFSVTIAIVGAALAFSVWRLTPSTPLGIGGSGLLLGLAVSGMHYCGVAAMRLPGSLAFDHVEVVWSIAVSIVFSTVAFVRGGDLSSLRQRVESSGYLALCVCGLHFTAMAAITIKLGIPANDSGAVFGSGAMAVAVGSVSFAILLVCLAATLMEQHLSQRAVQELRRMQLLSDISDEVLIIQRGGVILQVNAAGARMFGVSTGELVGCDVLDMIAESDHAAVLTYAGGEVKDCEPIELNVCTRSGASIPVELACDSIDYEGKPATVMALRDLSRRKRDAERIRHLALHDALTDLPNRFLLKERVDHALTVAARSKSTVALLYLDLDRFKPINDLLGHGGGDELLIQVARRMLAELRSSDTLARVGGDEFVVVTSSLQAEHVATLAGRLLETVAQPFDLDGHSVEIGVSIGIAISPADGDDQESLMRAADTALYRAKHEKRGTFRFFEPAMDEHLQVRRQLEQDLRHAAQRGELRLHFQPIVNCTSQIVDGYEALVRWQHPRRGLIAPMDFIALAEDTGSIVDIGNWVIEQACIAAASWTEPYRVAVNVSPVQFRQSDLPKVVSAALTRSGLPAGRLEIEITEGVLIDDTERAIAVLSALREMRVLLALDDFGTGYSSLSYLRLFKFDKLKIDKSFIKGVGDDEDAITIVRTIVGLAHSLGLSITAEGVETSQQLAHVRNLMCDHVQGYLLGHPVQSDELADLSTARVQVLIPQVRIAAAE
jgi:diguanylate cyclase (GGDEF)-like protein/PAS domain S-box-containing protein